MTPILCPICTRSTLEPIFREVTIKTQIGDGERKVDGLLAYKRTEFSDIFFVRKVDVEVDPELHYAV